MGEPQVQTGFEVKTHQFYVLRSVPQNVNDTPSLQMGDGGHEYHAVLPELAVILWARIHGRGNVRVLEMRARSSPTLKEAVPQSNSRGRHRSTVSPQQAATQEQTNYFKLLF